MTWLLLLLPVVAIVGLLWYYRRKAAAREALSDQRLKSFLEQSPANTNAANAATAATATQPAEFSGPAATAPAAVPAATAPPPKEYAVRAGLLTPPQRVLYYLLKTHLADHEVLAKVCAAGVIEIPSRFSGFERETRERRLALVTVDFVVCDKSFKPVAVVQCRAADAGDDMHSAFARECCAAAGLRWVDVSPAALPTRETVRAVVLGA